MPPPMKWQVSLDDQISGPAADMQSAIDKLSDSIDGLNETIGEMGEGEEDASDKSSDLLGSFDKLVYGAKAVGGAIAAVVGGVYDLGKSIEQAVAFKQTAGIALQGMLGNEADANRTLQIVQGFVDQSGVATQQADRWAVALTRAGMSTKDLAPALETAGDAMALGLGDPAQGDAVVEAFQRIHTMGTLASRSLLGVGISQEELFKGLPGTVGETIEEIQKQVDEHKFTPAQLNVALMSAISAKEHGPLDSMTQRFAGSLTGLFTRLEDAPTEFFQNMVNGMPEAQGALANLVSVLNPDSKEGKEVMQHVNAVLGEIFGDVFSGLDGPEGKQKIVDLIDGILDKMGQFVEWWKDTAWPDLKEVGTGIGVAIHGIGEAIDWLSEHKDVAIAFFVALGAASAMALGPISALVIGITALVAGYEALETAQEKQRDALISGNESAADKAADAARWKTYVDQGSAATTAQTAANPGLAAITGAGPIDYGSNPFGPKGATHAPTLNQSITIHVQGGDPQATAVAIQKQTQQHTADAFDHMTNQMGMAPK